MFHPPVCGGQLQKASKSIKKQMGQGFEGMMWVSSKPCRFEGASWRTCSEYLPKWREQILFGCWSIRVYSFSWTRRIPSEPFTSIFGSNCHSMVSCEASLAPLDGRWAGLAFHLWNSLLKPFMLHLCWIVGLRNMKISKRTPVKHG